MGFLQRRREKLAHTHKKNSIVIVISSVRKAEKERPLLFLCAIFWSVEWRKTERCNPSVFRNSEFLSNARNNEALLWSMLA